MNLRGDSCARISSRPRKGLDGKVMKWLYGEPLRKDFVKAAQGFSPTILSMARSGTTLYILHCPTLRPAQGAQGRARILPGRARLVSPRTVYSSATASTTVCARTRKGLRKDKEELFLTKI